MLKPHTENEPFELTERFFLAMQAKAVSLETHAREDAILASTLTHPDHIRRHYRLVAAQRAEAARYRSFLADASIRTK